MTTEERRYLTAREALASERDIEKALYRVVDRDFSEDEARELVREIYRTNKAENRKSSMVKIIPGALLFILFWIIFAVTGRLFYVILGFSGFGLIWGAAGFFFANGYEIEVQVED